MTGKETVLSKHFGCRIHIPDESIGKGASKNAIREWLEKVEDILGREMLDQGITLHSLCLETRQPNQIHFISDDTLKKYQAARNLWINKSGSRVEIGTEVMTKGKKMVPLPGGGSKPELIGKGQKFICSTEMARQLGNHLLHLADELEGRKS